MCCIFPLAATFQITFLYWKTWYAYEIQLISNHLFGLPTVSSWGLLSHYEFFAASPKRYFPSKLLRWFHLNNCWYYQVFHEYKVWRRTFSHFLTHSSFRASFQFILWTVAGNKQSKISNCVQLKLTPPSSVKEFALFRHPRPFWLILYDSLSVMVSTSFHLLVLHPFWSICVFILLFMMIS